LVLGKWKEWRTGGGREGKEERERSGGREGVEGGREEGMEEEWEERGKGGRACTDNSLRFKKTDGYIFGNLIPVLSI
jgi:hypothetical protein